MPPRVCLGPEIFLAVAELSVVFGISWYLNSSIAGFKAIFLDAETLSPGSHMGPASSACAQLAQADMCPALDLGAPSAQSHEEFLELTGLLRACGGSLGATTSGMTHEHGMTSSLAAQSAHAVKWALQLASPATSWAYGDYSVMVSLGGGFADGALCMVSCPRRAWAPVNQPR